MICFSNPNREGETSELSEVTLLEGMMRGNASLEIKEIADGDLERIRQSVQRAQTQILFCAFKALIIPIAESMITHVFLRQSSLSP